MRQSQKKYSKGKNQKAAPYFIAQPVTLTGMPKVFEGRSDNQSQSDNQCLYKNSPLHKHTAGCSPILK